MSLPGELALGSALASAVSIWGPASCAFVLSKASKESVNMWSRIRELFNSSFAIPETPGPLN